MNTSSIRRQLHNYLEVANDKKIKAMYVMMENEVKQSALDYTDELKEELNRRSADYKNDNTKFITARESKKRINKLLKSARKK
jgi:putative addiction module component (TIGR02574 family)